MYYTEEDDKTIVMTKKQIAKVICTGRIERIKKNREAILLAILGVVYLIAIYDVY